MNKTMFSRIAICRFAQKCFVQELWQYPFRALQKSARNDAYHAYPEGETGSRETAATVQCALKHSYMKE